jgi:hypothetical protein
MLLLDIKRQTHKSRTAVIIPEVENSRPCFCPHPSKCAPAVNFLPVFSRHTQVKTFKYVKPNSDTGELDRPAVGETGYKYNTAVD